MKRSWEEFPPLFEVVASFMGSWKKRTPKSQLITSPEEAMMLMKATGGKIDGIGQM